MQFNFRHPDEPWECAVCVPTGAFMYQHYLFDNIMWCTVGNACCCARFKNIKAEMEQGRDVYICPIGKCCSTEHPPEWEPGEDGDDDGDKNVCGPDVTNALNLTLARVETLFRGWPWLSRFRQCTVGLRHFDITELHEGSVTADGCKKGECCDEAVQVEGRCYPEWAVNWSMFGVQMKLCGYEEGTMMAILAGYTVALHEGRWIYRKLTRTEWDCPYNVFQAIGQKVAWARAGYAFAMTGKLLDIPEQPEKTAHCAGCLAAYTGGPFGIEWGTFRG